MVTRRRVMLALVTGALALPLAASAQPRPVKNARIGFLGSASAATSTSRVEALRAGMRELGYEEGKNLVIEFRWAEDKYERLPGLAAELAALKVDVIVTHGTPGARAAKQATSTIPIIMATSGDAVLAGLIVNVVRPEGNVTGLTFYSPELAAKRLEILRDTFPAIKRVAVLQNPDNPAMGPVLKSMAQAAKMLKLELQQVAVQAPADLEKAFAVMKTKRAEAVVVLEDSMLNAHVPRIAELAAKQRLPAIGLPELAEAGALLAYGVDLIQLFRRAPYFVDRILKGAKIADLPLERASTFELVLNLKTAKAFGLKIPDTMRLRADKIIQ